MSKAITEQAARIWGEIAERSLAQPRLVGSLSYTGRAKAADCLTKTGIDGSVSTGKGVPFRTFGKDFSSRSWT